MPTPDSADYRRYLNRLNWVRKAVVVAFAVCGIGYVVCVRNVFQYTSASGFYFGPAAYIWGKWFWGIGLIACLLAVVGLIGESLLRSWHRR